MKSIPASLLTAGLGAGAIAAYAFLVEPRWVEVTRTRIHLRHLPGPLEGLKIALLTDLHAGEGTPMSVIRRACRLAMRERPDVIAITGDLASDDAPDFQAVLEALDCLDAPLGVYAVPGNHDHVIGIERWRREMGEHPRIQGLTNRAVVHSVGEARLCVAGVDDLSCGEPSLNALPPPAPARCHRFAGARSGPGGACETCLRQRRSGAQRTHARWPDPPSADRRAAKPVRVRTAV
jgi:uncharacterized protein